MNAIVGRMQAMMARSRLAVRLAVALRNQAQCVVGRYLGDEASPLDSGEHWLVDLLARDASTFVDVGANVGEWSALFLSRMVAPSRGVLIEPSSVALAALHQRFGGDARVRIVQAAVSDRVGEMDFYEEPAAGKTSSLVAGFSTPGAVARRVRVTSLDEEPTVEELGYVDFLKIDAEGFDLHVLRGAVGLLRGRRVGVVQFEYNGPWARAGSTLAAATELLRSSGYLLYLLRSDGLYEFDYERYGEFFSYSNFVAVEPGRLELVRPHVRGRI